MGAGGVTNTIGSLEKSGIARGREGATRCVVKYEQEVKKPDSNVHNDKQMSDKNRKKGV